MYCKHCGKEIDKEASYCPYCGLPQTERENRFVVLPRRILPREDLFFSTGGAIFKIVSMLILGILLIVSSAAGLVLHHDYIWIVISGVAFILFGIGCFAHSFYGLYRLIKAKKEKPDFNNVDMQ